MYGYRELSADITCSKMQTIFESKALGKLFAEQPNQVEAIGYTYRYTFVKAKLEIFLLNSVPFGTTSDTVVFWIYFHKKAS